MWTIQSATGPETPFTDLGLSKCTLQRVSQGPDECSFELPLNFDVLEVWPYGTALTIRRDRAQATNRTFGGGSIWFAGLLVYEPRRATPDSETITVRLTGPWWYLDNLVYQQPWYQYVNPADLPRSKVAGYKSHVMLNMGIDGARLNTDWQIWDAVNYAAGAGAPLKVPTVLASPPAPATATSGYKITNPAQSGPGHDLFIDGPDPTALFPAVSVPFDEAKDIMCSEVVRRMIRWTPDVLTWFDYTTSPPTFHCVRKRNMAAASLDLFDQLRITDSIDLGARQDLRVPAVVLKFERTFEVNGSGFLVTDVRIYPDWDTTGADPAHADAEHPYTQDTPEHAAQYMALVGRYERTFSALVSTIDLKGRSVSTLEATIKVQALPVNFADATPGSYALRWWTQWAPWLYSGTGKVVVRAINNVKWSLEGTQPQTQIFTMFPSELIEGQVAPWMNNAGDPIGSQRVVIEADITYETFDVNGVLENHKTETVSHSAVSTNATTGTYSTIGEISFEESIPEGLAKELWLATNTIQWQGQVSFVEVELTESIRPGMVLNITSGNTDWATMNAMVQQVTENVDEGRTTIQLGPSTHLGPADLIELLRVNRLRFIYTNPNTRISGQAAGTSGGTALGNLNTNQDTSSGASRYQKIKMQTLTGETVDYTVDVDALARQILMSNVTGSGPGITGAKNQITHDRIDLQHFSIPKLTLIQGNLVYLGDRVTVPPSLDDEMQSSVRMWTGDISDGTLATGGKKREARFRKAKICVEDPPGSGTFVFYMAYVLMTVPELPPSP